MNVWTSRQTKFTYIMSMWDSLRLTSITLGEVPTYLHIYKNLHVHTSVCAITAACNDAMDTQSV